MKISLQRSPKFALVMASAVNELSNKTQENISSLAQSVSRFKV